MSIIKIMETTLSNKIAAGEVVEKLMNIVKELVENSIDAKADEIKIELIDSGLKEIKVTDNGIGMDRVDATNCLLRHATSKIYNDDDLFNIETLGFRGEALPSIASVSKMIIKTSNGKEGTKLTIIGGATKKIESSDLRKGTSITVTDIFFNTPARLKYLKSLYSELANIVEYTNKMALANPRIKFMLMNNEKVLLNTDGSNNLLKVISNIYGIDVAKKMINISSSNDDYDISGYISYPEITRSSKNFITILVNGRSVKNYDVSKTVLEAYHTYIPKDRYPLLVLNITCDPAIIDVNIHPTKMDIKFSKKEELIDLIYVTISKSLEKLVLIPEVKYEDHPIKNISEVTTIDPKLDFIDKEVIKPVFEDFSFDFDRVKETEEPYQKTVLADKEESKSKFKMIEPVALIHGTYIIGENEDGMFIMDQHAVNERINYEYYLEMLGKNNQEKISLLIPIKLEFSNNEYLILKENFALLDKLNIEYEEFGNNTIIIRTHPLWIKKDYVEESLRKIMEIIIQNEDFSQAKFNERIATTLACKMSIKANEHVSLEELRVLIEKLSKDKDYPPYNGFKFVDCLDQYYLSKSSNDLATVIGTSKLWISEISKVKSLL